MPPTGFEPACKWAPYSVPCTHRCTHAASISDTDEQEWALVASRRVVRVGTEAKLSEFACDRLDDRRRVPECFTRVIGIHGKRLVLALVSEVAECVELG
jgi:hypothetical protein